MARIAGALAIAWGLIGAGLAGWPAELAAPCIVGGAVAMVWKRPAGR